MKFSITQRVFLAILAATGIVVLCMFLIMQWSVDRGFLKYVNKFEQGRLERLAEKLEHAYAEQGNWKFLRENPEKMPQLIVETMSEVAPQPEAANTGGAGQEMPPPPGPQPPRRFYRLERRILLLDSQRIPVFGYSKAAEIDDFRPISHKGRVVGYLGLLPHRYLSDVHQLRFVSQQKLVLALVAGIMLVVAAGLSLPLARRLVRPLRELATATNTLASGQYNIRVPVTSSDELGQLSRDFNALALTLGKNEQIRRQFVADISHELRTPLAVLRGEIEALQDGVRKPDMETIGSLHGEVLRLNRLVDDLYQLALSDVGALSYRKTDVDLTEILAGAIDGLRPELAKKSLTLAVSLPDLDEVLLFADPERLRQLFDNVLGNSGKYTDPGGVIEVSVESGQGWATVHIKDSAPGVPPAEIGKLFDRLFRVESSRCRASGGAGLGLAICRNIVEAHEGKIEAFPSPLGGLWIKISLPLTGMCK